MVLIDKPPHQQLPGRRSGAGLRGIKKKTIVAIFLGCCAAIVGVKIKNSMPVAPVSDKTIESKKDITTSSQVPNSLLASSLMRTSGEGWEIVDWTDDIKGSNFTCHWANFTSTSGESIEFCTHPFRDIVSGSIRRSGQWGDCNILPQLWKDATKLQNSIYLEIGANIGACLFEMLLSTDAKIIAFEPHPMNQFNLRSTMSRLNPEYQNRVVLVPVGLGEAQAKSVIHSAYNNLGNSNIGVFVEDYGNQAAPDVFKFDVAVERLDTILDPAHIHIPLVKMDAQGFECKIMEGMGSEIADTIKEVKFEYAHKWLMAQNCTDLLERFRAFDFDLYRKGNLITSKTVAFKMTEMNAKKKQKAIASS
mmetsp:Transcript_21575/g.31934  ORF Transcript_21575/g.31934 Transcript_21575/m.31934 type:complete len:362 (+) Transcript_21575:108-1193(+)